MYKISVNDDVRVNSRGNSVITIGNFDGIHAGHMQLIDKMNIVAQNNSLKRILITFEPLPLEYFADIRHEDRFSRLSLLRDKYLILRNQSKSDASYVDELVILHFNSKIANLSYADFIESFLIRELNCSHIVIGHDFKFGKGGIGNIENLSEFGLNVSVLPPYYVDKKRVSSSLIRQYANDNQLTMVKKYLGRNLHYTSRVIHGNHLGRKFGVPTINLCLGRNKPALWGIYVAYVYIDGVRYNAVASIGKNPTVSILDVYKLEAHLLGVDLNLYGKVATVEILHFLREERKFDGLDILFEQIYKDLANTRLYFSQGN